MFDTSGTVAPLTYSLVDKVDPSLPGDNYLFGAVVDVEADYLAVGAPQEDTNAGGSNFAGAGYGFELVAGNYVEQVRTATEFGTSGGNQWGSAVALSGDYLVVGVAGQDNYRLAGRVLRRSGSTWIPLEDLLFPDERQNAGVGRSVAVGADGTVVTGAPTHDNLNGRDAGAAYVLQLPDIPIDGRIYAPDAAAGDLFGQSVDIHDDWMVVGAPVGDGGVADTGSAYIFRRNTNADDWVFVTELEASDGSTGQGFGRSVAIAGRGSTMTATPATCSLPSAHRIWLAPPMVRCTCIATTSFSMTGSRPRRSAPRAGPIDSDPQSISTSRRRHSATVVTT